MEKKVVIAFTTLLAVGAVALVVSHRIIRNPDRDNDDHLGKYYGDLEKPEKAHSR